MKMIENQLILVKNGLHWSKLGQYFIKYWSKLVSTPPIGALKWSTSVDFD
jgi:hypothetical protein